MKRSSFYLALVSGLSVACAVAWAQAPAGATRSFYSVFNLQVQVMTSDLVAVGKVEDSGTFQEFEVLLPSSDKPTKQPFQKFRLRLEKVLRVVGGGVVLSNTVVDVMQAMPPAITNITGCPNQKGMTGVFLMRHLDGRKEWLLTRNRSANDEANVAAAIAGVEGISWGQASNGLQMAITSFGAVRASTNDVYLRVGVAVRNVSKDPITLDRSKALKDLAVFSGEKLAWVPSGLFGPAVSNAPAIAPLITLLPNQIAMISPRGNPDMGFLVTLPPGEEWSVKATFEPKAEKEGAPSWSGRLETAVMAVKPTPMPKRMLPQRVRQPPPPDAQRQAPAAESKVSPPAAVLQADPAGSAASKATSAAKQ